MAPALISFRVLLSAPRLSAAIANARGTHAVFTVSSYSFESKTEKKEIRILDLQSGNSTLFLNNSKAHDPCWLEDENEIIWLEDTATGLTELYISNLNVTEESYSVGKFDGPVSNLKVKKLADGTFAIAVTGKVTPDGVLYNPEDEAKPFSKARIYRYVLSAAGLINALEGTSLECPMPPFGGLQDFDISRSGIAFATKNPENLRGPVKLPRTLIYYIPRSTYTGDLSGKLHLVDVPGSSGDSSYPVFSPNGESLAFLQTKDPENVYGGNCVVVADLLKHESKVVDVLGVEGRKKGAILSAQSVFWNKSSTKIYTIAIENGRGLLFQLSSGISDVFRPFPVTSDGTVTNISPCGPLHANDQLLVTSSSLIDSCVFTLVEPAAGKSRIISSSSKNGLKFGLSPSQISEFWFPGAADIKVHVLVVKPSNFDESKSYPLALFIHGGPMAAWTESWSTRWNATVFAEQGYVVVMPNLTGSLGYGQEFIEAIYNNWGGSACIELANCFEQLKGVPYIDCTRSIALGGSYGGYLINRIASQPLAREIQAMVCRDRVFSLPGMYACDLSDFDADLGGPIWEAEAKANFDRWDPAQHTDKWTTPTLYIHSDLDYNLPVAQGLAPFTILQRKGIDSMFLNFADEGHFVLKPENPLVWHQVLFGWMDKHSKSRDGLGSRLAK